MEPRIKSIIDDLGWALGKAKAVADAVSGSPITSAMEHYVPDLGNLVAKVAGDVALVGSFGAAIPGIEAAIAAYEALGGKPMDFSDPSVPGYEDRQGREEITG